MKVITTKVYFSWLNFGILDEDKYLFGEESDSSEEEIFNFKGEGFVFVPEEEEKHDKSLRFDTGALEEEV